MSVTNTIIIMMWNIYYITTECLCSSIINRSLRGWYSFFIYTKYGSSLVNHRSQDEIGRWTRRLSSDSGWAPPTWRWLHYLSLLGWQLLYHSHVLSENMCCSLVMMISASGCSYCAPGWHDDGVGPSGANILHWKEVLSLWTPVAVIMTTIITKVTFTQA